MKKNRGRDIAISLGVGVFLTVLVISFPEGSAGSMAARERIILHPERTVIFFSIIVYGALRLVYNLRAKKNTETSKEEKTDQK